MARCCDAASAACRPEGHDAAGAKADSLFTDVFLRKIMAWVFLVAIPENQTNQELRIIWRSLLSLSDEHGHFAADPGPRMKLSGRHSGECRNPEPTGIPKPQIAHQTENIKSKGKIPGFRHSPSLERHDGAGAPHGLFHPPELSLERVFRTRPEGEGARHVAARQPAPAPR